MSRGRADRIAAYVDSPALCKRVRLGQDVASEVRGSLGTYVTRASIELRGDSSCTCPSELRPCKHVEALRETYRIRPGSFVDAGPLIESFASDSKEAILARLRHATLRSPGILSALALAEFDDETPEWPD